MEVTGRHVRAGDEHGLIGLRRTMLDEDAELRLILLRMIQRNGCAAAKCDLLYSGQRFAPADHLANERRRVTHRRVEVLLGIVWIWQPGSRDRHTGRVEAERCVQHVPEAVNE